ncbi:Membrane protein involved in the export of O-antigen and teichoic acid [Tangfeifania diversioriginum]|uniref:Membrane protein involved in the export of O-antigen and teichoic acid n=1 Tax=Tangfeifania diversioriginum TaxID=1168035 RepID=A0A1M6GR27_9BACT|nr:oligosaccharide flippase family protein [Tangfeifania diversioriginum]SHJ12414.1 Membrane protein involved in the export of O-antigen and teichoic acid [Tangfeifania diversioriginum]
MATEKPGLSTRITKKIFSKRYLENKRFKQVMALSMVNVIGIPLSIVSSMIITRFLGPESYGDFKFLLNVFNLAVVIFSFGFFQAGNRALVLNHDLMKGKEYYGAMLIILSILFIIMSIFLISYAFFDNNINEKGLRNTLIFIIPFSWIFLLVVYFEVLFQADNKIKLLANSRLYPKLGFFISVLIIYSFFLNYTGNKLQIILGFFLITQILVFIYIIYKINPSFKNLNTRMREIFYYNKTYGFNVYLGSLFSVGFAQLTGILISYFAKDNSGVGYFSLAATIASPLSFIPNVIATTHYKDFSTSKNIPRKLIWVTILISASALLLTLLLVSPFINIFYGQEFHPVISLTYIVSFGIILSGLADFFNRFLGAHGKGGALRNSSFLVGLSTMAFNLILIPRFGETGAACTLFFSGLIYLSSMSWYYRKLIISLKDFN